ncbi:MAG: acyl-CoA thioesterase [Clostridiaceae bacterium]|jgi:acyl-CoA thioester hydrolase|nr:acyl-CoA thioesterase [Clostridiaceae bacterium]
MFITQTPFVVRYAETDQMGVVHHSNYPVWFEAGRTDFIRKMGLPYSKIEEDGAMLPLLELKCSFKGFARYEDEIIVKTSIKDYTGTRLMFHYEVCKAGSDKPITEGETVHCWTDSSLKPVNIKKFRPEIFDLIEKAYQSRH